MPKINGTITDDGTQITTSYTGNVTDKERSYYFDDTQNGMVLTNNGTETIYVNVEGDYYNILGGTSISVTKEFYFFSIKRNSAGSSAFTLSAFIYKKGIIGVEDVLTSTNSKTALSANQGRILNSFITNIAINVKTLGAKGDGVSDDTQAFIDTINAAKTKGKKVYVPDGTYMVKVHDDNFVGNFMTYGVLELDDNMTFEMSENAILKVIPNNKGAYNVLMVKGKSNVTITGGKILGDRSQHTGSTGEWGYGIALLGAKNVTIRDMTIVDCWGDGINLQYDSVLGDCENIHIDNVVSDNNRRQGMSIESAKNVRVLNSKFLNTNGTAPQAGLDIEPATTSANCENIIIDKCEFKGNAGNHILIHSNKIGIKITNCDLGDNTYEAINVNENIKGLQIIGNTFAKKGIFMYSHTGIDYGDAFISNNVFKDVNKYMCVNRNTIFVNNKVTGDGTTNLLLFIEPNTQIVNNSFDKGLTAIFNYDTDIADSIIKMNEIRNVNTAIDIFNLTARQRLEVLNNNIIDTKKTPISIKGINNGVIKGNTILTNTLDTADTYYGILIHSVNNTIIAEGNTIKVPTATNKFKKAIFAYNGSANQNIKMYFNNLKDSCTTAVNEIDMTGISGVENTYNITNP